MIAVRAPGKLMIAGEYAVLEPGRPAVVVAVDRWVEVRLRAVAGSWTTIRPDPTAQAVRCRRICGELIAEDCDAEQRHSVEYVIAAVSVVTDLVEHRELPTCAVDLAVTSALAHPDGRKYGLGSSAAVTAATVTALDRLYTLNLTAQQRYRLSLLATATIDPQSSGADLAACVWGGWLAYCAPDRRNAAAIRKGRGVEAALADPWPGFAARRLPAPDGVRLLVGWTGRPASTRHLLAAQPRNNERYRVFLDGSAINVWSLITAIHLGDARRLQSEINCARKLLAELAAATGIAIMTPELAALCAAAESVGAAAKPSGAGGGDCGIAVIDSSAEQCVRELKRKWAAAGIEALPLKIAPACRECP
ncbi:phosphomevalonate kinase [Nocardia brasiliensis]|uniref:phosphomevalonate kinase n=1 Tax=Nocardia brasiliensis TaxID=37326 RepID=UPI002453A6FE|nr:phosphomevalonate kinase [Nocardia brasiliensis]